MKVIAFILIVSMGFLGLNRFMIAPELVTPQTKLVCSMDCCTNQNSCCCDDHWSEKKHEPEETPENGPECSGGCDCSYSIQILAMECLVQSQLDLTPRVFNHASFQENYYFDYLFPHFQPPRKA